MPMRSNQRGRYSRARAAALMLALVCALTPLGVGTAYGIARNTVLTRAQTWIDRRVPYSQTHYYGGYRTDCSGFASMCWATHTSWSTRSFGSVTSTITVDQLRPGDGMLKKGYHIRIFYGWVDEAHTLYVTYEQTGPTSKSSIKSMASDLAYGYRPVRYDHIVDNAAPRNLLRNGAMDVWARPWQDWSHPQEEPVWWQFTGSRETTLVARRMDVSKSARNAVELINASDDLRTFTEMSQEISVTPETTYTLSAWTRTANDPAGVEMQLEYLDATGRVVLSKHTSGNLWHVDGVSFKQMAASIVSPPRAVRALVTMRLAGGTTSVSATEAVPGTSAVLDEISFVVPRVTVGMKASATHSHVGRSVYLSGAVAPNAAVGARVVVYVQKPGSSAWVRWHNHFVYASAGAAKWSCAYPFKTGMRTGVYAFKTQVAAFSAYPGWLGSTSSTVRVTLQ